MEVVDSENKNRAFLQAITFVNQTNQSLFVTGKAGTGKTTFLKYITENTHKKVAVTAPTGVAAMNAGGMTLHSLFWLPFGTYLEDYELEWKGQDNNIYNKSRLFSTIKLTRQRRKILQELELLIIDEVSMVRADTLDAIDAILKSVRRDMRPFGGLQLLLIGDLFQLPPVVRDNEWTLLRQHYNSPFFFDAKVIRQEPILNIEFDKVYRQRDNVFINLLNHVRTNTMDKMMLDQLNESYKTDFSPSEDEGYITLTSHNRIADRINQEALNELGGMAYEVKAVVRKDFQESMFPVDEKLSLKIGAQVMFIKNDSGEERKYYNGRLGRVKKIDLPEAQITVEFVDGSDDVVVNRETWENIKYKYDADKDKIDSEVLGTFSQFPLRLAWAITIHKSQGLTFDKAIIDAGTSFAPGQVYVALSRLTSIEGLVLKSIIPSHAIRSDEHALRYLQNVQDPEQVDFLLQEAQKRYLGSILLKSFRWNDIVESVVDLRNSINDRKIDDKGNALIFFEELHKRVGKHEEVANKFLGQLHKLLRDSHNADYTLINNRVQAAVDWFLPKIKNDQIFQLVKHIDIYQKKKRVKKYMDELHGLLALMERKANQLEQCVVISTALLRDKSEISAFFEEISKQDATKSTEKKDDVKSKLSTDTKVISLDMFLGGMSVEDIAKERGMVYGTIFGHLLHFVGEDVEATDLMDEKKLDTALEVVMKNEGKSTSEIKMILGNQFDYPEIRLAQRVLELQQT